MILGRLAFFSFNHAFLFLCSLCCHRTTGRPCLFISVARTPLLAARSPEPSKHILCGLVLLLSTFVSSLMQGSPYPESGSSPTRRAINMKIHTEAPTKYEYLRRYLPTYLCT
jgi:hypothetical protein